MNKKEKKGISSKLSVMRRFVEDGYYVYNETNNTGPVDFVAINSISGDVRLIEVKTMSFRNKGPQKNTMISRSLTPVQKSLGVEMIYYNLINGDMKWRKKEKKL